MARRGRRPKATTADVAALSSERQLDIDFTVEQKAEAFDQAGALWARIDALKAAAAESNKTWRKLERELTALHREAAAGKRKITVETFDEPDFANKIVLTKRRDTGEVIPNGERAMTQGEIDSGTILTGAGPKTRIGPEDAKVSLSEVAAHTLIEAHPEHGFQIRVTAPHEEEEYPLPSAHPADVAAVIRVAHRGGATTEEEAWVG